MAQQEFPSPDMALTTILVVSNMEKSKAFYKDVLGAKLFREYGGDSAVFQFLENWILLVTKGEPTKDKPELSFMEPKDLNQVSHSFTIRVKDCMACYAVLKARGADFLTPPVDWGTEIRGFFRDPDGHLFEISQA